MNKIYVLPEDELRGEIYQRILLLMGKNRGSWQSVAAAVSLFGGLVAIALGALDWAFVGLFAPAGALGSFLDAAGTILLILPLPLLALGAFCLDLLEKKPPALPLPPNPGPRALCAGITVDRDTSITTSLTTWRLVVTFKVAHSMAPPPGTSASPPTPTPAAPACEGVALRSPRHR